MTGCFRGGAPFKAQISLQDLPCVDNITSLSGLRTAGNSTRIFLLIIDSNLRTHDFVSIALLASSRTRRETRKLATVQLTVTPVKTKIDDQLTSIKIRIQETLKSFDKFQPSLLRQRSAIKRPPGFLCVHLVFVCKSDFVLILLSYFYVLFFIFILNSLTDHFSGDTSFMLMDHL